MALLQPIFSYISSSNTGMVDFCHHCRIERTVREHLMTEEPLHHKVEQTLYKKLYSFLQRYTFSYYACLYFLLTMMIESQDRG